MTLIGVLLMVGCTSSTTSVGTTTGATATTTSPVTGTITVYAATSLTKAFTDLGRMFEQRNPGTTVKLNFNGSSTLVTQIVQGAPADLFASADFPNMNRLVDSGLTAGAPRAFTRNHMQIAVAKGNPKAVTGVADLARSDLAVVLCATGVPCGDYARQVLTKAAVTVTPKSNEQNVGAVIGRVASGEADAGIAYATDILANTKIDGVTIPSDVNVVAEYPLVVLNDAPNPTTAEAFITFIRSADAQKVFATYGFLPL
jgi:molybdate transport system substrate-binding protein